MNMSEGKTNTAFSIEVGKRLKECRLQMKRKHPKKFGQNVVARELGILNTSLARYKSSVLIPDYETLVKLANLYGVTTDYLLTGKNPEKFNRYSKRRLQLVMKLVKRGEDKAEIPIELV